MDNSDQGGQNSDLTGLVAKSETWAAAGKLECEVDVKRSPGAIASSVIDQSWVITVPPRSADIWVGKLPRPLKASGASETA